MSDPVLPTDSLQVEALLRRSDWLRRLVRSMASNQDPDDIVQDIWVRALRHDPGQPGAMLGWLRRVAQNLVSMHWRADAARRDREQQVAQRNERHAPATDSVVEQLAAHRELTRHVLELPEPYRTTITLRFFENRSFAAIAAKMDTSETNVRKRSSRAIEILRQRLTSTEKGRVAWLALTSIGWKPSTAAAAIVTMTSTSVAKFGLGVIATALAALLAWQPWQSTDSTLANGTAADPVANAKSRNGTIAPPPTARGAGRTAVLPSTTPEPTTVRRGRVLDAYGRILAGVPIATFAIATEDEPVLDTAGEATATTTMQWNETLGKSDEQGRFTLTPTPGSTFLGVAGDWATLHAADLTTVQNEDLLIVAAARVQLRGRVIDPDGQPVRACRVQLSLEDLTEFPTSLDQTVRFGLMHGTVSTDDSGAFDLGRVASCRACRILAVAPGFANGRAAFPDTDPSYVEIQLTRRISPILTIRGRVLDDQGRPVDSARVGLDSYQTDSTSDGRYELRIPMRAHLSYRHLYAASANREPAVLENFARRLRLASGSMTFEQDLVLGAQPVTCRGRVLDEHGKPRAGIHVYPFDLTYVSHSVAVEELMNPASNRGFPFAQSKISAVTDAAGRFALRGLRRQPYRIRALDRDSLQSVSSAPQRPTAGPLELRLEAKQIHEVCRGQVLDDQGIPIANAYVQAYVSLLPTDSPDNGTTQRPGVTTDANGQFEFKRLARGAKLVATERRHLPGRAQLSQRPDVEIRIERRCHFRVELSNPGQATFIAILNAKGERLRLTVYTAHGSRSSETWSLDAGKSPIITTSRHARSLLILDSRDRELRRHPIVLEALRTTLLRY